MTKSDYDKLLERAESQLPESVKTTARFEVPKVLGHLQGSKTVITNFIQIVNTLRRDPQHLLKFLLRELASPGNIDGNRLVLGRKISSKMINDKIQKYVENFVLCPDCKKPDTQIKKEDRVLTIKCMACGAKHPIKAKI